MRLRPAPAPACRPGRGIQKGGIVQMALKSEVARLLDQGGAETSEIENDGNRAPTHAEKKSRFSAGFSLSMGSVLSARLLDLMLAGHPGSSLRGRHTGNSNRDDALAVETSKGVRHRANRPGGRAGIAGPPWRVAHTGNADPAEADFSGRARRCLFQAPLK